MLGKRFSSELFIFALLLVLACGTLDYFGLQLAEKYLQMYDFVVLVVFLLADRTDQPSSFALGIQADEHELFALVQPLALAVEVVYLRFLDEVGVREELLLNVFGDFGVLCLHDIILISFIL